MAADNVKSWNWSWKDGRRVLNLELIEPAEGLQLTPEVLALVLSTYPEDFFAEFSCLGAAKQPKVKQTNIVTAKVEQDA